jgi:MGT family glycosyltransferase
LVVFAFRVAGVAHIAFFGSPSRAHVYPSLPIVAELVRRGHRVTYPINDEYTELVAATGAEPLSVETTLPVKGEPWPLDVVVSMERHLTEATTTLPHLLAAYEHDRPDVVVHDRGTWTGRLLAHRWGVPATQFSPSFVTYRGWDEDLREFNTQPAMVEVYRKLEAWLAEYGMVMAGPRFIAHPDRGVVTIPRCMQFRADDVGDEYTFVGPCFADRTHDGGWRAPGDRPVLLVSLGSSNTDEPPFYRECFKAFGSLNWHVVVGIGAHVDPADLGPVPPNTELLRWVPQWDVLSQASAFVTHNGMGGTLEALHHGVPMVGVPITGEQIANAHAVAALGVGQVIPWDQVTAERLREAVLQLARDPEVAARLAVLRKEIHEGGGAETAADAIEALVGK